MTSLGRLLWVAATISGLLHSTHGHASGAPSSVCGTMTPKHTGTKAQLSLSPFEVGVPVSTVQAGGRMTVIIRSKQGIPFKGFLLEARDVARQNSTVGTFVIKDPAVSQLVSCGGVSDTGVTHRNSNDKTSVSVDWVAPLDFTGEVHFWATFVRDYDTYWTNQTSQAVSVTGGQAPSGNMAIYNSCGQGKACLGLPSGCVERKDCQLVVSYVMSNGKYMFEMDGKSNGYVAVGLSNDDIMGNDSVVDCVREGEQVKAYMSWNLGKPGRRGNRRLQNPLQGLSNVRGSYKDGRISCSFTREAQTNVEGQDFNLDTKPYYLMLASGDLEEDGALDYHYANKIVTPTAFSLRTGLAVTDGTTPLPSGLKYDGCGKAVSCFGFPTGCVEANSCEAMVTYSLNNGKYTFEITGPNTGYVAFGLSADNKMGNDSVVECFKDGNQIRTYMSWNFATETRKGNRRLPNPNLGLSDISASDNNGQVTCKFVREQQTSVEGHEFDLSKDNFYLMLALGPVKTDGSLGYHDDNKVVGSNPVALSAIQPLKPADDDPIYEGCAVTKACFGYPSECAATKSCEGVVAYSVVDGKYSFELRGQSSGYIAFGLSFDDKMGDDSVVECMKEGDKVSTYMSWNFQRSGRKGNERLSTPHMGLEQMSGSYKDGWINCKFVRAKNTTVNGMEFNLDNSTYYLMVALGEVTSDGNLEYHETRRIVSVSSASLSSVATLAGKSNLLKKLHGAFMITAWIGAASCGILLARYFKQTWTRRQICGKDVWFAWHRVIMTTAWGLTIAAFVLIFVELQGWTTYPISRNPHAVLGCITTALAFIQPIMAFFRPHPGTPNRPVFNWAHWLVGNLAQILGIITIFFAVTLPEKLLPEFTYWILVAFVGYHCLMHLIFSIHQCQSDRSGVHVISPPPNSKNATQSRVDAPGSTFRKLMLAFYLLVNWVLTIVLVLLVVFSPIENHIKGLSS